MKISHYLTLASGLAFGILTAPALCRADVKVTYTQTLLPSNQYKYDYTLFNTFTDPGYGAYDLFLNLGSQAAITGVEQPAGWVDLVSLGTFPISTDYYDWTSSDLQFDVQPGSAKIFSLTSSRSDLDVIQYQVTVSNPTTPASPLLFSGITTPTPASGVPEPGMLSLSAMFALCGAGWIRRRKQPDISQHQALQDGRSTLEHTV